ncbi:DUF6221 family protein [Nocardia sp. NPDC050630]|uniref:DUF6221 family protein n=1 Tax=Nocardia sp. NPDC050630 TaxID=3364321 RepID=UPI0037B3BC65
MTATIVEFIEARLAEDEAMATAAGTEDHPGGPTSWDAIGPALLGHLGRHDPARVLRQCAALRAIIADHAPDHSDYLCTRCVGKRSDAPGDPGGGFPCGTVLAIAAIWAEHLDYREEWRP